MDDLGIRKARRHLLKQLLPGWLVSLTIHLLLLLVLAIISIDPEKNIMSVLQLTSDNAAVESIDEFRLDVATEQPDSISEWSEIAAISSVDATELIDRLNLSPELVNSELSVQLDLTSLAEQMIPKSLQGSRSMVSITAMLDSRGESVRSELLERYGGSAESEKAVALALKWLARHQITRGPLTGAWSFNHAVATRLPTSGEGLYSQSHNAATALAILPFLGAGQTHIKGQYQETVRSGLLYLMSSMRLSTREGIAIGSWHEMEGTMYSHALASIAICEAYAMTLDPDLVQPAQLSLNYLIYSQDPRTGGWRYEPQQPGDTSVAGWCLMALKSGSMGNLLIPPSTWFAANRFLDLVSSPDGAHYGYRAPSLRIEHRTTAIGLLCRMYLGWPREHAGLQQGVQFLIAEGPKLKDLYFTYYATQVIRHLGGQQWDQWNAGLRDPLVQLQVQEGDDAGSWDPDGPYSNRGGRLYQTAMAAMILEVYYRHLPLYKEQSLEFDDFEI